MRSSLGAFLAAFLACPSSFAQGDHDHDGPSPGIASQGLDGQRRRPFGGGPISREVSPEKLQQYRKAHADLEEFIRHCRQDNEEHKAVKEIAEKADRAIESFERNARREAWKKGKLTDEDVNVLINGLNHTQRVVTAADALADKYLEWKAAPPDKREAAAKEAQVQADIIRDAMAPGNMPDILHMGEGRLKEHALMGGGQNDISQALLTIGFKMDKGFDGHLGDMVRQSPTAPVYNYAANLRARTGDLTGAERDASKAIELDPNNVEALTTRASARYNMNDFGGAMQDSQAALRIDPSNEAAKGILQFAAGRLGPAMAAPSPGNPWSGADDAARLDRRGAAPLRGAEGISPEARESAQHAAEAARQFQLGDLSAARRSLDRALEVNPANADAHAKRAWLNAAQGRMSDAVADLSSVLKLDKKNGPGAVSKLAAELNKRGRYLDAKSLLGLIRPEDRDARAWFNLAAAENGLGDRDAMMAALKRAAALDPASYGGKFERALRAAPDEDLGFLFDQVKADANRRSGGRGHGGDGAGRLLLTVLSVLIGGFLVALGLLHSLVPQVTRQWTTRIRSAFAGGPNVAVAPEDPPEAERQAAGTNRLGGNYELVRQIGLGGMGIVYEGLDTALGRRVAVKKMREEIRVDPRERERFISEARTVAKLKHPGIVEIHTIVEEGDDVFLVFEYVDGSTLYELLDRKGRLPLADALRIAQQAGDALAFAHGRDIIHRDLKPSNIMLTEGGTVKVMDFGVARQAKDAVSKLSMTNTIVGTPPYMAPEQEQGLVCKESDVYALAICFYELVTGRLPFQGTGAGMLLNKMNKSYAPPSTLAPDLPASLDGIMAKAFEPDPARRYRTVAEFLAALKPIAAPRG